RVVCHRSFKKKANLRKGTGIGNKGKGKWKVRARDGLICSIKTKFNYIYAQEGKKYYLPIDDI
ncbi:MAG: hypothetical protein JW825_06265, partial [Candidatus Methanofastidiosa archaeon]|nr:hypothetical protein [Candidatus Methanofastidiosa archaeon]